MITKIEAVNYRCFERLDVDLQSFVVLVAANGAGKTTLLDIPGLLGDCLGQQNIAQAFITRQNNKPPRCSTLTELVTPLQYNSLKFNGVVSLSLIVKRIVT